MRQLRVKESSKSGFTLIELIITVSILVVALTAYVWSTFTMQQTTEEAFEQLIATQDANQVIEQMRSTASTGLFPTNVVTAFPNNTAVPGFANLQTQQVTVNYANPAADPLDVTVSVAWTTTNQRQANTSLRTYITQR
jgi:prepilin-type N-terminal cleavage/methylation domain-containing protein